MQLQGFIVSKKPHKKYDAILYDKDTGKIKHVPFGDTRYFHYKDKIGHYKDLDHNDKERRRRYRLRHYATHFKKYSPSYFAWHYLW